MAEAVGGNEGDAVTRETSIKVVFRHAVELAAMKDDPDEGVTQLFRSVGNDQGLLLEAHAHYAAVVESTPNDETARRALTLVEWALTGVSREPVVIRGKRASAAG